MYVVKNVEYISFQFLIYHYVLSSFYRLSMKLTNVVLSDSFTDLLKGLGIKKSVKEGDIILQEHAYLNSIPIVTKWQY